LIAGFVMLVVMNQIHLDDSPHSIIGKTVVQAIPMSIGASVANRVFGTTIVRQRQGKEPARQPKQLKTILSDIGATVVGGVFLGSTVAPTDEVPVLAADLD